jgi:hypothetical protein
MEIDETYDFGFSLVDASEVEPERNIDKLQGLYNMVEPLLDNLCKNPEKDYIYWPNRVTKIEEFKTALRNYIDTNT